MPVIRTAALVATLFVALFGYTYLRGPSGTDVQEEALAASVRDNPGSYRPSYSSRTGFVSTPVRRGGGGIVFLPGGRSRTGGGYRHGK